MTLLQAQKSPMAVHRSGIGLIFLLVGLTMVAAVARAVPVANLYQATVPVDSSKPADRSPAFSQALRKVMARIAGTDGVLGRPALQKRLDKAEPLVESYRYQKGPDEQDEIQVAFGPVGVNQALASAGVPVWGANRPLMVVWAAVDSGADRNLVTPDSGEWSEAFNQAAQTWGLPIVLPRYDQTDRQAVNLSEVWGQFMDSIQQASKRYHADLVIAMRIDGGPGQWNASWQMQGSDVQDQGTSTADNPRDLMSVLAKAWAGELARRYAVSATSVGSNQWVDLAITGVSGLKDYAGVRQALRGMTPIRAVAPVTITQDKLILRVKFAGELTVLKQYIALDHRFKATAGAAENPVMPPMAATSAPVMTSAPAATSAPVSPVAGAGQANADAAIAGLMAADANADSHNFSRLYPSLHYVWAGAQASAAIPVRPLKPTGSPSSDAGPGKASGSSSISQ